MSRFVRSSSTISRRRIGQIAQKMRIAGFAGAGLAGQNGGEGSSCRLGAGFAVCGSSRKAVKGSLDGCKVLEGVETVGTAAKFAGGLRTAKDQKAKNSSLVTTEIEDRTDTMFVLRDTGVANRGDESEVFQ